MASPLSPRAAALLRTLQATFAAMAEHQKTNPDEVAELARAVAAHLYSAWPQSFATRLEAPSAILLDTGPVPRVDAVSAIERRIEADGKYRLTWDEGYVVLQVVDEDDIAVGVMTPSQGELLRADLARVIEGGR